MSSNGVNMNDSGAKIENQSTAQHAFNSDVALNTGLEINPVSGNLVFNGTIYVKNNWINVWGDNAKTLYLNGVVNADGGNGGLAVKQNSIVS